MELCKPEDQSQVYDLRRSSGWAVNMRLFGLLGIHDCRPCPAAFCAFLRQKRMLFKYYRCSIIMNKAYL